MCQCQTKQSCTCQEQPTPHPHAALIKAWADGAIIQYYMNDKCGWMDTLDNKPAWHKNTKYRIKPQVKTIQYRNYLWKDASRKHTIYTVLNDSVLCPSTHPSFVRWIGEWKTEIVEIASPNVEALSPNVGSSSPDNCDC